MIDPDYLYVLEEGTEVFVVESGGMGQRPARLIAGIQEQPLGMEFWMPGGRDTPAYKTRSTEGAVYMPQSKIRYIADLTGGNVTTVSP